MHAISVEYTNSNGETPAAVVGFDAFTASDEAEASNRCLSGSCDHWAAAEYTESGSVVINGETRPAVRVYLFADGDILDDDGEPRAAENYPWDAEHCARIRLTD